MSPADPGRGAGNVDAAQASSSSDAQVTVTTSRRRFEARLASVRLARLFAAECAADLAPADASALKLLVSELATNCVKHSKSRFEVQIEVSDADVIVRVSDKGPGVPKLYECDPSRTFGRGLYVLQELAQEWGVVPADDGTGKVVWFSMART